MFFPLVTEDGEWISVRFSGHAYLLPITDGLAYHPYCGWESATTDRIFAAVDQLQLPGGPRRRSGGRSPASTPSRGTGATSESRPGSHGSEAEQAVRVQQVMQEASTSPHVAGAFNFLLYDEAT